MEELETVENIAENPTEEPAQEVVEEEKSKKPKKSKLRKILDAIVTTVSVIFIGLALVFVVGGKIGNGYVFGYQFPLVLTDSMVPDYPVNIGLIVKKVQPKEIKVGDDVMFKWTISTGGVQMRTNMTHRIYKIEYNPEMKVGIQYTFYAHGINTHSEFCKVIGENGEYVYGDCTDTNNPNNVQKFNETSVVGKVVAKSYFIGGLFSFVQHPAGLITLILVPAGYIMITSVIDVFKKLPDEDEETANAGSGSSTTNNKLPEPKPGEDPLAGLSEEEIERLKKQLYKELLGKGGKKK